MALASIADRAEPVDTLLVCDVYARQLKFAALFDGKAPTIKFRIFSTRRIRAHVGPHKAAAYRAYRQLGHRFAIPGEDGLERPESFPVSVLHTGTLRRFFSRRCLG
jgi:hypothetical protein